jgi:hypothetical protein
VLEELEKVNEFKAALVVKGGYRSKVNNSGAEKNSP